MALLKLSSALALLILGLQFALLSTTLRFTNAAPSSPIQETPPPFNPTLGLYLKNYAGKPIKVVGEGKTSGLSLTLPNLRVDEHIWEGKSITLECWSDDYPVYWEYQGLGAPSVRVDTSRTAPNYYNASSYSYGAVITFSSSHYKQTGEYSCRPTDASSLGVSLYLFAPGSRLFVASDEENKESSVSVAAEDDTHWVTLPCATSEMDANVQLTSQTTMKIMQLGENLSFDPSEGFRLKWKGSGSVSNPFGGYTCAASNSKGKEEKLFIKLTPPKTPTSLFSSPAQLGPQVSISYNAAAKRLECCSSILPAQGPSRRRRSRSQRATTLPRMSLRSCVSISDCFFTSTTLSSHSTFCSKGSGCASDSFVKGINESCVGYELPDIHESGVLDCSLPAKGGRKETQLHFSYHPHMGLVTNFEADIDVVDGEVLSMGREEGSSNGTATYFCHPSSFFFSSGIKWGIIPTGTNTALQFLPEDGRGTIKVDEKKAARVFCFAPVWDSPTAWRNISMGVPNRN